MAEIGKINELRVVKKLDFGVYLDGDELGEILLPRRLVPDECTPGDLLSVFIYLSSEDRLIATTEKPTAVVGEFALMHVVSCNEIGAFLDWGLQKDLLVPFREQKQKMEEGKSYIVYVYFDEKSGRIAASAKLNKFLKETPPDFKEGQEVDILICNRTEIGYNTIINNSCWGVLYANEVFQTLEYGQKTKGFIKKVREDKKIDLTLNKTGYDTVVDFSEVILNKLKDHAGFLPTNDKSSPETIYKFFGVSKKVYKKAVGSLYKKKLITIEENGIRLTDFPGQKTGE